VAALSDRDRLRHGIADDHVPVAVTKGREVLHRRQSVTPRREVMKGRRSLAARGGVDHHDPDNSRAALERQSGVHELGMELEGDDAAPDGEGHRDRSHDREADVLHEQPHREPDVQGQAPHRRQAGVHRSHGAAVGGDHRKEREVAAKANPSFPPGQPFARRVLVLGLHVGDRRIDQVQHGTRVEEARRQGPKPSARWLHRPNSGSSCRAPLVQAANMRRPRAVAL
jgi:hypothetical protein